jgi:hypothetical protein
MNLTDFEGDHMPRKCELLKGKKQKNAATTNNGEFEFKFEEQTTADPDPQQMETVTTATIAPSNEPSEEGICR